MSDNKDEKKLKLKDAFKLAGADAGKAVNEFVDEIKTNWRSESLLLKTFAVAIAATTPFSVPLVAAVGGMIGFMEAMGRHFRDSDNPGPDPKP